LKCVKCIKSVVSFSHKAGEIETTDLSNLSDFLPLHITHKFSSQLPCYSSSCFLLLWSCSSAQNTTFICLLSSDYCCMVVFFSVIVQPLHILYCVLLLCPGRGAEYCYVYFSSSVCLSVCLSVSISPEVLIQSLPNFMAVARSSSGSIAIRYVGPTSGVWMASYLHTFVSNITHTRLTTILPGLPG